MASFNDFVKISDVVWEIPRRFSARMRVPARIYASEQMLKGILDEKAVDQLINMCTLSGIETYAVAMPDIHQGYGFPIGGVAAFRVDRGGVISPGGVGYDINCGVRLLSSQYFARDFHEDRMIALANQIQRDVPSGVGRGGRIDLSNDELDEILNTGAQWSLKHGYATDHDLAHLEENGCYQGADANEVPLRAKQRGRDQLGTLGAGNHFLEVQEIEEIYDQRTADIFGLKKGQVTVMIHTGSRGLGHQLCTEYVRLMEQSMGKYGIVLPDRELACVPFSSPEGQRYFKGMAAAANFAWANRQMIVHHVRGAFARVLGGGVPAHLMTVYDVAHNIAKLEEHGGRPYIVHRKGATRAFGPHDPRIPSDYQETGQPVLIPGSMGTYSYVLAGTAKAMRETFGSSCHGAGRKWSRAKAKRMISYEKMRQELEDYGVLIRAGSKRGLLEEAPEAYKDIEQVVDVVHRAGIARKVARLKPLIVVKG